MAPKRLDDDEVRFFNDRIAERERREFQQYAEESKEIESFRQKVAKLNETPTTTISDKDDTPKVYVPAKKTTLSNQSSILNTLVRIKSKKREREDSPSEKESTKKQKLVSTVANDPDKQEENPQEENPHQETKIVETIIVKKNEKDKKKAGTAKPVTATVSKTTTTNAVASLVAYSNDD